MKGLFKQEQIKDFLTSKIKGLIELVIMKEVFRNNMRSYLALF